YFDLVFDVVRDLGQVLDVLFRDQGGLQATAYRSQQLFFQAADRQDFTAQGDFAGHAHFATDRDAGVGGDQRRRHGNARRRAVLGRGAFRNVDVDVGLLEGLVLDAQAA